MGVDYYTCAYCDYNFPDCGNFFPCSCGVDYCTRECGASKYDEETDESTCRSCRKEWASEIDLLEFLLNKFHLNREAATRLYFAEKEEDAE